MTSYRRRFRIAPRIWILTAAALAVVIFTFLLGRQAIEKRFYPFAYRDEITTYAQKNGLDPLFVASIIKNESRFNPNAVSNKGAVGLMQIMPDTGRWVAQQIGFAGFDPAMLKDPATNIMMGTWYLSELKEEFGGKIVLTVAAYNAGRGQVREWVNRNNISLDPAGAKMVPWPGDSFSEDFPVSKITIKETRNYVRGVLAALNHYRRLYEASLSAGTE